jgi:hypothetical protein
VFIPGPDGRIGPGSVGARSLVDETLSCRAGLRRPSSIRGFCQGENASVRAFCRPAQLTGNNADSCIRSAAGKASPSRRAVSALRIQGIGLNRREADAYGDSIPGRPPGEGTAARARRYAVPARPPGLPERWLDAAPKWAIRGLLDVKCVSADRESTVTLQGRARRRSVIEVTPSLGSGFRTYRSPPARWSAPGSPMPDC